MGDGLDCSLLKICGNESNFLLVMIMCGIPIWIIEEVDMPLALYFDPYDHAVHLFIGVIVIQV